MIVVDASALLEALVGLTGGSIARRIFDEGEIAMAPHLIDIEVAQTLRRLSASRRLASADAEAALANLAQSPLVRHDHTLLLPRICALRHNLSAYDAAYVALAEALGVPLETRDARIAAAPGHRAQIEVV